MAYATLWLGLCLGLAATAATAVAAPPARLQSARTALLTGDHPDAADALTQLAGMQGMPAAARAIVDGLEHGLPDDLVEQALETLSRLGGPDALAALAAFSDHRRVAVRLAAYRGLIAMGAPTAPAYLEAGLRDSDPRVRDLCAQGLGDMGAQQSTEVLLLALARGVYPAARAIGQVGDGAAAVRYAALLERLPLGVMLGGYRAFLGRTELPSEDKRAMVARLEEVASPEVRRFLQTVLVTADLRAQPDVKKAIEQAIQRIADPPPAPSAPPASAPEATP